MVILPDDHSFIHRNEILLPRLLFFLRHQLPFRNAQGVGWSIRGTHFFSDQQHVTPCLRLLTIHRDGSLSLINHNEINRPVLLLCLGFDHAIHLTFY